MILADIFSNFKNTFLTAYGHLLFHSQLKALDSIIKCRTPECGSMLVQCPDCKTYEWKNHSCKNRHCPKCQNHDNTHWLNKEQSKLLPVNYFLVTFTIPSCLRETIWKNQKVALDIFFDAAANSLKELAADPKHQGGKIGMTAVMHLHSRMLNFHPHIHFLIPNGAIDTFLRLWKSKNKKFFLPTKPLAKLFRGKFLAALRGNNIKYPKGVYLRDWIINVENVGSGLPALKYLTRYLYRGIINDNNISLVNNKILLKYKDRVNNKTSVLEFDPEVFILKYLRLTFPPGFRRTRSYGFLHGNAKSTLQLIQLVLKMKLVPFTKAVRPTFKCPVCSSKMFIVIPMAKREFATMSTFNKGSTAA